MSQTWVLNDKNEQYHLEEPPVRMELYCVLLVSLQTSLYHDLGYQMDETIQCRQGKEGLDVVSEVK